MPCKQYFLNYFGQNKGYHGLFTIFFQLNSFSSTKQWILGKNVKIRDFHYFLFEPTKIRNFQASLSQLLKLRINREDLSWRQKSEMLV